MDKTAFIPKKNVSKPFYKSKGPGLFFGVALFLLVISGLFAGGVYAYRKMIEKRVGILSESLKRAQAGFEPALIIELNKVAGKIDSSKILLKNHRALTPIFEFLQKFTLKTVSFSKFDYKFSKDEDPLISMGGTAKSYASLALQEDEFQKSKNVKNVSVSNLSLSNGGSISFNIEITFNPDFIKYRVK